MSDINSGGCSGGPIWSNTTVPEGTMVGRAAGGDVAALTAAQVRTVIGVDASTATDWIGASRMTATTGSPSLSYVGAGGTSRAPAWLLDASSAESAYGALRIPAGWSSFHVDLWWSNAGAGSGDVVWRADRGVLEDGVAVPTLTSVTLAAVTAPAQNVIKVTRVLADIAAPAAGKIIDVGMLRDASAAGDTLANDVAFVGLMLIKAS